MLRAFSHVPIPAERRGPLYIGLGLAVVLLAQIWPAIPIAAAIGLIGLGATVAVADRRQSEPVLALSVVIYGALTLLALGAQLDVRYSALTICDAAAAVALIACALSEVLVRAGR